ncbi:hypothetical protein IAT38_004618 [Cryptococcus sp. DSM 104549]
MSSQDQSRPPPTYHPTTGTNTRRQEPGTEPFDYSFVAEIGISNGPNSAVPRRPQTVFSVNNPQFPARPEETWRTEPTLQHWWNPKKTYTETSYTKNHVIRPQSFLTRRHPLTVLMMGSLIPLSAIGVASYLRTRNYEACDARADDWEKAATDARTKNTELEQKIQALESSCQGTEQLQRRDPVWVSQVGSMGEQEDEEEVKVWWVPSVHTSEDGKSFASDSALETTSGDV